MLECWRIVRRERAADAFTGEGARQFGGRWNSPGVPIVYASEHQSLAALEILVHLQPRLPLEFVVFRLAVPDDLIARLPDSALPLEWRAEPPRLPTMQLGDAWYRESQSAVLAIPSTIIPEESNLLLNPRHPDYPRITIHLPHAFSFDPRLVE